MPRGAPKTLKTFRFDPRLIERVDRLAESQGITRTRVFELALINLLEPAIPPQRRQAPVGAADRQARLNRAKGL